MADYSEDEIRRILIEYQQLLTAVEICEKWEITPYRLRKWQKQYGYQQISFRELVIMALYESDGCTAAELIPYLDYRDHARYPESKIAEMLEKLELEGIAVRREGCWSYDRTRWQREGSFIF